METRSAASGRRPPVRLRLPPQVRTRQILDAALAVFCERGYAAARMDDTVLQQLRTEAQELGRTRSEPDWAARAIAFDVRFHDVVAEASGSARLRAEIRRYRLLVRAFCRITGGQLKNLQDSYQEHLAILRALEKRDPKAARKAMADHIQRRVKTVLAEVYQT